LCIADVFTLKIRKSGVIWKGSFLDLGGEAGASSRYWGLSQKTVFAPGGQKIFSFFNLNKKLQSNFLFKLKK
jgi:hypothetical protein